MGREYDAELDMARRRQAVAAVAMPWIVRTLDVHGCSNRGMARDALTLLLVVSQCRHSGDDSFKNYIALMRLANPVAEALDAHTRDAGVVQAGLALLAEVAKDGRSDISIQVGGVGLLRLVDHGCFPLLVSEHLIESRCRQRIFSLPWCLRSDLWMWLLCVGWCVLLERIS